MKIKDKMGRTEREEGSGEWGGGRGPTTKPQSALLVAATVKPNAQRQRLK